jgi:hypothetical protein
MNRRNLLKTLAALPLVGIFVPKPAKADDYTPWTMVTTVDGFHAAAPSLMKATRLTLTGYGWLERVTVTQLYTGLCQVETHWRPRSCRWVNYDKHGNRTGYTEPYEPMQGEVERYMRWLVAISERKPA